MLFIILLTINIFSVIPLISLFKPQSFTKYIIGSFILFCSIIIFLGNLLGMLSQLNNQTIWLICHIGLLAICWSTWFIFKKPKLFPSLNLKNMIKEFSVFEIIILIILSSAILICFLVLLYLIINVPPNNNDSMVVHLVRVGYWIQQGSFKPWDAFIERQIIYPYNAQIILLWLTLFIKNDLLTPLLQFFCSIFTAASIYGIARTIGANRFVSLTLGGFYLTFPQVILQSTTTQNDLVITFFIASGTLFLLDWIKSDYHSFTSLILCGIAYAISLGIKATSYYFFIGLAVSLVILLLIRKTQIRRVAILGGTIIIFFMVLSSQAYINNYFNFGTPLGPENFIRSESGIVNQGSIFEKLKINGFRFIYQITSLDGYPFTIQRDFNEIKKSIAQKYPNLFDTSIKYIKDPNGETFSLDPYIANNEDLSWFGPIFLLLTLSGVVVGVIHVFRKKDPSIIVLITTGIISFLLVTVLRPGWDPYQGRYINISVAVLFPLSSLAFSKEKFARVVIAFLIPFTMIPLFNTTFINDSKPLITQSIMATNCKEGYWNYFQCILDYVLPEKVKDNDLPKKVSITRLDSLTERQTYTNRSQMDIIDYIEELPSGSKIAIILSNGDWEYPYFGRNFQFRLIPIPHPEQVAQDDWEQMDADYIVVHNSSFDYSIIGNNYEVSQRIITESDKNDWIILQKK